MQPQKPRQDKPTAYSQRIQNTINGSITTEINEVRKQKDYKELAYLHEGKERGTTARKRTHVGEPWGHPLLTAALNTEEFRKSCGCVAEKKCFKKI